MNLWHGVFMLSWLLSGGTVSFSQPVERHVHLSVVGGRGPKGLQLLWHQTAQFNRQGSLSHSSETYPRLHTKALETGAVPH